MQEPDLALSVKFRLPREGVWVQVWFAGYDERWAYAKRQGLTWLVDSRELPSDVLVGEALITHWRDEPPPPGEPDPSGFFETAADVVLEAMRPQIKTTRKRLK